MANKMISTEDLRDDFLSAMVRSDQSLRAPEDFTDGVMSHISSLPPLSAIKPFNPPVWLKWGIPGIVLLLPVVLMIWNPENELSVPGKGSSFVAHAFDQLNSWFSGLNINIDLPGVKLSATITWIMAGSILLTWGFLLLARFLNKKAAS